MKPQLTPEQKAIAGQVVQLVGGLSVSFVVQNAITSTTPTNLKPIHKLAVGVGSWMIAATVSDAVVNKVCDQFGLHPVPAEAGNVEVPEPTPA